MSAITANGLPRAAVEARAVSLLASAAVAFGVFLQAFVIREPAPYELFMVGLIAVWALFGLRLSRHAAVLLALLVAYNIGGLGSMSTMGDLYDTPLYLGVTLFLALTSVFFAAILEADSAVRPAPSPIPTSSGRSSPCRRSTCSIACSPPRRAASRSMPRCSSCWPAASSSPSRAGRGACS